MTVYQNTLVAIDPCVPSDDLIEKAIKITADKNQIILLHVLEVMCALPTAPYAPVVIDSSQLEKQVRETAGGQLQEMIKKHGLNPKCAKLLSGSTASTIKAYASERHCDAIVIGSHGRHGISLLLGSTATSVIHGCDCDVLVVRLKE